MNTDKEKAGAELAYAALDDVPTPKADAKEIVGLVKHRGRISGYQLSDGSRVSKEEIRRHQRGRYLPPERFRISEIPSGRKRKQ